VGVQLGVLCGGWQLQLLERCCCCSDGLLRVLLLLTGVLLLA
jgi:hypothetical protein